MVIFHGIISLLQRRFGIRVLPARKAGERLACRLWALMQNVRLGRDLPGNCNGMK
jgi:hypothetical protein